MCLILFSFDPASEYPLIVLANRDEFHRRPTARAGFWKEHPRLVAGRDLEKGGTWMGVTTSGRFAAVTNYRSPRDMQPGGRSRGDLPLAFLTGDEAALSYLAAVQDDAAAYAGFNLLVFDGQTMGYLSNRSGEGAQSVRAGVHGLSNALLDTAWPKVAGGREALQGLMASGLPAASWMRIMADTGKAADDQLPDTGIGLEKERLLSSRCIESPEYGTRCTSFVCIPRDGPIEFVERTLVPKGLESDTVRFLLSS